MALHAVVLGEVEVAAQAPVAVAAAAEGASAGLQVVAMSVVMSVVMTAARPEARAESVLSALNGLNAAGRLGAMQVAQNPDFQTDPRAMSARAGQSVARVLTAMNGPLGPRFAQSVSRRPRPSMMGATSSA